MELKKNVKHGHLLFFQWDICNLYVKMRKMHAVNDAVDLLQFVKLLKKGILSFNMHSQLMKRKG